MKIDRRCFLSFVIGGAAGTALTPLPWKLADDSAIWTQNWPWTPVPEKGEAFYGMSTCTLCPGGCGISIRMVDDRTVKIEGLEGHPVNDGGICNLGLSGLQLLYGPNRVTRPLKRVGNRGDGHWEAISWEDGIGEITKKLTHLRSNNQAHTVGCILGNKYGTVSELFKRFLTAYGSPNVMTTPSLQDSLELTLKVMHGVDATIGYDFENADYILSFGSGLIEGWGSPVRMFRANSAWKENGVKVVQVEPRLSNTAAKSDHWIAIKPGTEAALTMGIMHVMIKNELYHSDFIEKYSNGFSGWKQLVLEDYTPDKVASITGVASSVIEQVANEFARSSRPLAICGRGQGDSPVALNEAMAVHALNAIAGNINKPGGIWIVPKSGYVEWPDAERDRIAENGLAQHRIDGAGTDRYPITSSLLNQFANAESAYDLEALLVSGANPCYSMTDASAFKKRIEKIPFVVSFSPYMDETSMNVDLILPNHVYLERYEDVPISAGLKQPAIGLSRPVVAPLFDTMHVGDVVIQLAQGLGGSIAEAFPWESYDACLEETLADQWAMLDESGIWMDEGFQAAPWEDAFKTASGKFEFGNASMDISPGFSSLAPEGDQAAYPLILMPYDSMRVANGYISNPPFVMKTIEDTVLKGDFVLAELNPETAESLGLSEGSHAKLSTPKGEALVMIHLYDGIMPGVVAIPRGLGHHGGDTFMAGKGVNINELMGPVEDRASGLDVAWGIRAKLTKA